MKLTLKNYYALICEEDGMPFAIFSNIDEAEDYKKDYTFCPFKHKIKKVTFEIEI